MRNIANTPGSNLSRNHLSPSASRAPATLTFAKVSSVPSKAARVFRVIRWATYGSALILLILLLHKAAPPPILTNPEAAARAEQKFADVQQAVSQGQPATLRMDETELNSYLATHLELAPSRSANTPYTDNSSNEQMKSVQSNVRDVKVQLIADRVRAYVVFDVHGKDMTLQLEGRLGAKNGFLKFEPVSGQIGALPIPQSTLEAAVRKMMESPENHDKLKLPDEVSDLRIENGEVVATYQ